MRTQSTFKILFFIFLFYGCSSKQEVVEGKHADGSPKEVGIYMQNIKTGEIKYYENGKKEMEGSYNEKLERNGKWVYWFKNGKVWSECEYNNGLKNGKSRVFYENGQLRYEGNYLNDTASGPWKFWNEKGVLIKELDYP